MKVISEPLAGSTRRAQAQEQIRQTLASTPATSERLPKILEVLVSTLRASAVSIFVPQVAESGEQWLVSMLRAGESLQTAVTPASRAGVSAAVLRDGCSILVGDVREDPRYRGTLGSTFGIRVRALMAVPIRHHERVIGVIEAVRAVCEGFADPDRSFLQQVARNLAPTVEHASLLQQLRLNLQERELLLKVIREVNTSLEIDEIMEKILDCLSEAVPMDAAGIFLFDEESAELRVVASRGYTDLHTVVPSEGIAGASIQSHRGIIVDRVDHDERYIAARGGTRAEMAVPMATAGEVIGAINLESNQESAYGTHHLRIAEMIAGQVSTAITNARFHRERLRHTQVEHELSLAREIQVRLLPGGAMRLGEVELDGISVPSSAVGGDAYDFFVLNDRLLCLSIVDVSGHGLDAALLMASTWTGVRLLSDAVSDPAEIAWRLNRTLYDGSPPNRYVTAVLGVLDTETGHLRYCNAGHHPPLRLGANQRDDLLGGGPPLGLFASSQYRSFELHLEAGDLLVFHTDGLIEATDNNGHEFGRDRLVRVLTKPQQQPLAELIEGVRRTVRQHCATAEGLEDDVTLMLCRFNSAAHQT